MTSPIPPSFVAPFGATPTSHASNAIAPGRSGDGFGALLDTAKTFVGDVSDMQRASGQATRSLALGETDDVIGTLATVEKASIAFKTLLAVRSKLMAAFDEVRNMPV